VRVQHVGPKFAEDAANLAKRAQAAVGTNVMEIEIAVYRERSVPQAFRQRRAVLAEEPYVMAALMQPVRHLRGVPRQRVCESHIGCQQDAQGITSGA
jgi:hypothetical protein